MGIAEYRTRIAKEFTQDIWARDLSSTTRAKRRGVIVLKWGYLVLHGFWKDRCTSKAAALTYTTVLSIVPFLAVAFSISKGLGLQNQDYVRELLLKVSAGRVEIVDSILSYIDNTNLKTLGWVGMGTLFVTVISLVGTVEKTFNDIWKLRQGRTLWRKFTDFFSVTLLCPVVIVVSAGVTVSLERQEAVKKVLGVVKLGHLDSVIMGIMPLIMVWAVFVFVNSFVPNTRVKITAAAIGGVLAGSLWQWAQWGYIRYQVGVAKYNAIYGSFAQLPLFLVWLYISWAILLLGAEISYAVQHLRTFEGEQLSSLAGVRTRQKVAVLALLALTRRFDNRMGPARVEDLTSMLGAPNRLISEVFLSLCAAGLAVKTESDEGDSYALASAPEGVTILDVADAVSGYSELGGDLPISGEPPELDKVLADLSNDARSSSANLNLKELNALFQGEEGAEPPLAAGE